MVKRRKPDRTKALEQRLYELVEAELPMPARIKRLEEKVSEFEKAEQLMEGLQPDYKEASIKFGAPIEGLSGVNKGIPWAVAPDYALAYQMQRWLDLMKSNLLKRTKKDMINTSPFIPSGLKKTFMSYLDEQATLDQVVTQMKTAYKNVFGRTPRISYK